MQAIPGNINVQIQALYHAGYATHYVSQDLAVDPLFALAKARDFPEVYFAAAFDDGHVILGCKGELPQQLKRLAHAILPQTQKESSDNALANIENKLAALAEILKKDSRKLDALNTGAQRDDLDEKLEKLETHLASTARQTEAIAGVAHDVSELRKEFTAAESNTDLREILANLMEKTASKDSKSEEMHRDVLAQIAQLDENLAQRDDPALTHQFSVLEANLIAQIAAIPPSATLPAEADHVSKTQQQMHGKLSQMANDLAAFCASQGAASTDLAQEMRSVIAEEYATQTAPLSDLSIQMKDLRAELSSFLNAQSRSLSFGDDHPALALQRQTIARFQTAMGQVLLRLEACAHTFEGTPPTDTSGLLNILSDAAAKIEDLNTRSHQMEGLLSELAALPDSHNKIVDQLSTLCNRPNAPVDLTEQRRSFASFGNMLSTMAKRIDDAIEGFASLSPNTQLIPITDKLDQLMTLEKDSIGADQFAQFMTSHADAMDDLQNKIADCAQRPVPVLDLTQQRQSFAHFLTALSETLKRFDAIASQLDKRDQQDAVGNGAATDTGSIVQRDAMRSDQKETETVPKPSPMTNIDAMRYSFAELIARQMQSNSALAQTNDLEAPDR